MSILAMIEAIIALPGAINGIGDKIMALIGAINEANKQKWLNEVNQVLNEDLAKAQSREDFQSIAKKIQDLTAGI